MVSRVFNLTEEEKHYFILYRIRSGSRFKLNREFTQYLSRKLNINSINCHLNASGNFFKKANSRKSSSPYWSGNYYCKKKDCGIQYHFFVRTASISHLHMIAKRACNHGPFEKFALYGKRREDLKKEILIKGSYNVKADNFLLNSINANSIREYKGVFVF